MLNNFIGGGQVFLHKIRMFQQVFTRTVSVAFLLGAVASVAMHSKELKELDWEAFYSYRKAVLADEFDGAINSLRMTIGKNPTYITYINIKTKSGIVKTDIDPRVIREFRLFQNANSNGMSLAIEIMIASAFFTSLIFCLIFILWSKFGKSLKAEKTKDGANKILTAKEVKKILKKTNEASDLKIGDMPLVKDMETRHFLVTGSTGSGKTNLMHNMLPQIEKRGEPAIVIDNTGEMIAKYYDPKRGDIIFNPFDSRGKAWDFWSDCSNPEELERFSKILFGFNRKRSGTSSDPFWEQSAEIVFNACVEYLVNNDTPSMSLLKSMALNARVDVMQRKLKGTSADRYLGDDGKGVATSVLSMLSTTAKPISYLCDNADSGKFSLKEHFQNIKQGSNAWLFLATKPSSRQLTQSLIACLTELSLCQLLDIGIKEDRRLWFIIDELASLGKLPALPTLMSEGRKYGSCIICGLQSLNQLYSLYGQYEGSSIFGQFGTSFFFRNTESLIAKQISDISGMETITRQQKNTSFGANEFRDGISYNEHQQKKPLIEPSDLSSLATGSCYVFLPEPDVRMAKIKVPYNNKANKHDAFLPKGESLKSKENNSDTDNEDSSKNDKDKATNAGARKTESTNYKENSRKQKKSSIESKKEENKNSNKNACSKKDKTPHERSKPKTRVVQKKQNIKTNSDNKLINNV
jgi:type IV conjugative transfer system coupling protein TraD